MANWRRGKRLLAASAALVLCAGAPANAFEELSEGQFIVAGSFRQTGVQRNDHSIALASQNLSRCGLRPFNDFSDKFLGFAPGYDVVVTGPYLSEPEASFALAQAQRCIPDAYLKNARYLGE